MKTERLSVAAAIVKFLQNQYMARDGVEHRLINGVFGIFGHGNVTQLGQAIEEYGGTELPFYQGKNEQCMVHAATAFTKTRRRLGTLACTSSIGPGATNMLTGAATATWSCAPYLVLHKSARLLATRGFSSGPDGSMSSPGPMVQTGAGTRRIS